MNRWTSRPAPDAPDGLVLFDGVCPLCSNWVRFVIEHDAEAHFCFLPLQSERGRQLAESMGISPNDPETNVVILDGRAWFKSDALLRVLSELGGFRRLAFLRHLPRRLRDPVYDLIARSRYRVFGRTDVCMAPSPRHAARFLS